MIDPLLINAASYCMHLNHFVHTQRFSTNVQRVFTQKVIRVHQRNSKWLILKQRNLTQRYSIKTTRLNAAHPPKHTCWNNSENH